MFQIILFIIATIINVALQTIKSIVVIKSSVRIAALINAIAFGFYTLVLRQLTSFDLIISISVTMFGNFIGVYLANYIINKFKKDKIWIFNIITKGNSNIEFQKELEKENILFNVTSSPYENNIISTYSIYANTQKESEKIIGCAKKEKLEYFIVKT